MRGKISQNIHELFTTLCEIQEIMYLKEEKRTSQIILRAYNVMFWHSFLFSQILQKGCKKLTKRKAFGKYYHALSCHAPQQLRIISGRSSNTEQEERVFNFLKSTAGSTSNHHGDNVIINSMVRYQVKKKVDGYQESTRSEKDITKMYSSEVAHKSETVFEWAFIKKYPNIYQAH